MLISTVLILETLKSLDQSLACQISLGVSPIWFLEVAFAVKSDRFDERKTDFLTYLSERGGSMRLCDIAAKQRVNTNTYVYAVHRILLDLFGS